MNIEFEKRFDIWLMVMVDNKNKAAKKLPLVWPVNYFAYFPICFSPFLLHTLSVKSICRSSGIFLCFRPLLSISYEYEWCIICLDLFTTSFVMKFTIGNQVELIWFITVVKVTRVHFKDQVTKVTQRRNKNFRMINAIYLRRRIRISRVSTFFFKQQQQ